MTETTVQYQIAHTGTGKSQMAVLLAAAAELLEHPSIPCPLRYRTERVAKEAREWLAMEQAEEPDNA